MREEVERFGGTVAQLTGDGVLALFGVPTAHEDDSERAVRAALALHQSLARYAAEVAPELRDGDRGACGGQHRPGGRSRAARRPRRFSTTRSVTRSTWRLGCRSSATLWWGRRRRARSTRLFELEQLGELELKGRSEPVSAFRVIGVHDEPPCARRGAAGRTQAGAGGAEQGPRRAARGNGRDCLDHRRAGNREVASRRRGARSALPGASASSRVTPSPMPRRSPIGRCASSSAAGLVWASPIPRPASGSSCGRSWRARSTTTADEAYPFLASLLGLVLNPEQEQRIRDLAPDAVRHETFYWLYQLVCTLAGEHRCA